MIAFARRALAVLLVLLTPPVIAVSEAQEVSGRIQSSTDSSSVAGALVVLVDSLGREVTRTMSTPSGRFSLKADGPGRFHVRVIRIGFASWMSPPVLLAVNQLRETRFMLEDRVIKLAEIEVLAARSRCGVRVGDGDVIANLLLEAEKALAITEQTIRAGNLRFRTETYLSRPSQEGGDAEPETATSSAQAKWPVLSAPPESLAVWGFVHEPRRREATDLEEPSGTGPVYFAPDARVLFADWFLDEHCFSVNPGAADSISQVVVEFTPVPRPGRRDIRGRLVLDRRTLELRTLEFWYTGLGRWVKGDSAGGRMSFRRLGSGAWIIDRWVIRAPIPYLGRRDTSLFGYAESGGRVTEIRTGRSGDVERISQHRHHPSLDYSPGTEVAMRADRAILESPSSSFRSNLCARHWGCWEVVSSSPSWLPGRSRVRSEKWAKVKREGRFVSRPVLT
jgi:hypothetical protein